VREGPELRWRLSGEPYGCRDAWIGQRDVRMGSGFRGNPVPLLEAFQVNPIFNLSPRTPRVATDRRCIGLWLGEIELRCLIDQEVTLGWSPGR
jgi:hypothetical protein